MDIEVGDILETGSRSTSVWTIVYSKDDIVEIQFGQSDFTHIISKQRLLHNVHVTKMWAIKKKVSVLNKEALEEL